MGNAYKKVKLARNINRPTSLDFINNIFNDFIELHGDRNYRDDKAIIGGIAKLNKIPVTVIGIQKGTNVNENIYRNFGQAHPEGYRKALRLMKQAEKFNRPVITFINTAGAFCGKSAEERGQGEAIARNLFEMSGLTVPTIAIIIGEGGSGGALALGLTDKVWILENAIYSVLSPEGFASILFKDGTKASEVAELMKITSTDLLDLKIVDKIIPEDEKGIHKNPAITYTNIKINLIEELNDLIKKDKKELLNERYTRFRNYGEFNEV